MAQVDEIQYITVGDPATSIPVIYSFKGPIKPEIHKPSIIKISLKIIYSKFRSCHPGGNELVKEAIWHLIFRVR